MDTERDATPARRKLTREHQLTGRVLVEVKTSWERLVSHLKERGVRVAGDKINSELALNALILGLEQYSPDSIEAVIADGARRYEEKVVMPTPRQPEKRDLVAVLSAPAQEAKPRTPKGADFVGRTVLAAEPPARPRKRSGRGAKK